MYAGLQHAQGNYVAIMDADLQDPPALLPEMMRGIRDEVREIKAEVKAGREDIKNLSQTVDSLEKRLKKVENVQENDIKQDMRQLFEGQRTTLEKFQSVNEINDRVKDIQGATDVLKVLTVKKV